MTMKTLTILTAAASLAAAVSAQTCGTCPGAAAAGDGGFVQLFDGKSLAGWRSARKPQPPEKGWVAENGVLTVLPKSAGGGGGDIITEKKYSSFIFKFEFQLTAKANSGVKYLFDPQQFGGTTMEYQVLDPGHPDAKKGLAGTRAVASLYDVMSADAEKLLKPLGEWNQGMVVVQGMQVEHWLNGEKVLMFDRGSDAFAAAVAQSKFKGHKGWGTQSEGHLLLQDHNDRVSYRNLMLKELK